MNRSKNLDYRILVKKKMPFYWYIISVCIGAVTLLLPGYYTFCPFVLGAIIILILKDKKTYYDKDTWLGSKEMIFFKCGITISISSIAFLYIMIYFF